MHSSARCLREIKLPVTALAVAFANNKLLRVPVIEKLDEAPARGGFVDDAEFNAISKHLSVDLQTVARVAYTFGWRKEEIFSRQLRHLDLDGGTLRRDPGETKNGAGRLVRLTPEVKTALAAQVTRVQTWMRSTGRIMPWLFPHLSGRHEGQRIDDLKKAWARACRLAGRPGLLFHDLRRSAVRNMEKAGVPRSVAMKQTGHKTENIYKRYAIVSDADLAEAAHKMSARRTAAQG